MVQNGDFFIPYLLSTSPIRESASEYCGKIWYENKLQWCAHTTLKKSLRIFTRFYAIQERAGQQDRKANGRVERPVQSNDIPSMVQTTESHFCNSAAQHSQVGVSHAHLAVSWCTVTQAQRTSDGSGGSSSTCCWCCCNPDCGLWIRLK